MMLTESDLSSEYDFIYANNLCGLNDELLYKRGKSWNREISLFLKE